MQPVVEGGKFPAKACRAKESWSAPLSFREGHDQLGVSAVLLDPQGQGTPARPASRRPGERGQGTDRWEGLLTPDSAPGNWSFVIEAWHDRYGTWHHNAEVKVAAGIDVELMLAEGAALLSEAADDAVPQRGGPAHPAHGRVVLGRHLPDRGGAPRCRFSR